MKTYKKILFGLVAGVAVLAGGLIFTNRVSALDATAFDGARFTLTSLNTIQVQLRGSGSEAGPTYNFVDSNISDNGNQGEANYKYNGSLLDGGVCSNSSGEGITLNGWPPPESNTETAMLARLNVRLVPTTNFEDCLDLNDMIARVNRTIQVIIPANFDGQAPPGNEEAAAAAGDTCEAKSISALTWIMCPVFTIAEGLANFLLNLFMDQLCFKVDVSPTSPNTACQVTPTGDIKPAWSAIKNIVSALLIIIMLIAIFAQALSFGPIDAYTLRKMLPRLVAAVILIQISWYLFSWIINLVDDVGEGLMALLQTIFARGSGGVDINNLGELLANAGIDVIAAVGINWLALIGLVIAGVIALPLVMLMIFTAVVALLVALAVLIFRKVAIIALLLIAPVALLLWVLPNTENYWKMWWQNFIKVLLMFPLIVLIIEAGRIFAFVAGPTAGEGSFIALFIILVGFFGPLFILPKTYKWGGSLMAAVGDRAFSASDRYLTNKESGPGKYFRNRQQDWQEQRRRASMHRVATGQGLSRDPRSWYRTPLDRFRSGKFDPLKQVPGYRDVGRRSEQAYVEAGEELHKKDVEAARQKILREGQGVRASGGNWDQYFQARSEGWAPAIDASGNIRRDANGRVIRSRTFDWIDRNNQRQSIDVSKSSGLERTAGRTQTAILGAATNWRYLESLYERMENPNHPEALSADERVETRKFFDDNVDKIMPKMPHVYVGVGAAADSKPEVIGNMHGVGVEAILSRLSNRINDPNTTPEERERAQTSLTTFLQNFESAANNSNIDLDTGALRAVKAFLDPQGGTSFRRGINVSAETQGWDGRTAPERSLPELPAQLDAAHAQNLDVNTRNELDRLRRELAANINEETGTYNPVAAPQAPTPTAGVINIPHGQPPPPPPAGGQPPAGGGRFNPPPGSTTTGGFSP